MTASAATLHQVKGSTRWVRPAMAVAAGLLFACGFAPVNLWVGPVAGVALLAHLITTSHRARAAVGLFWLAGLVFQLTSLSWLTMIFVSAYIGLAVVESLFWIALGAALWASRKLGPLVAAGLWTAMELLQSVFPFDGFAWNRLGYAAIDSPLSGFYPLVGAGMVTFVIAALGHLAAWAFGDRQRALIAAAVAGLVLACGAWGTAVPASPATGTVNVGWVQGGAPGGSVYGLGEAGTMERNHAAETFRLMQRVKAGEFTRPDFIAWPENGTDMDPLSNDSTKRVLDSVVAEAGVPVLVTSPTFGPGAGHRQTTSLWWTDAGPTARYAKRNLVPFGEWVPYRDLLLPLIPPLQYVGDQGIPGTQPGVLNVTTKAGKLRLGTAICFEVAFPTTMRDANGGDILVVGSSNAMYQGSSQIEQQFAITRVRAAELRREILVVTTSGVSGLIDEYGSTVVRGIEHEADSGVVPLKRMHAQTPYSSGGWVLEYIVVGLAVLALVARLTRNRLPRRRQWRVNKLDGD